MKLLIDSDTASDDAVALIMAMESTEELVAITTVAGNVPVEQATQNALFIAELCECHVPIYQGSAAPLLGPLKTAQFVHGEDGMGDIGLPLSGRIARAGEALDVIIETIRQHPGEVDLVTLGPLTNIAASLSRDPAIARLLRRCVIMGGTSDGVGNVTPAAEFNIWADPEAAEIVFRSQLPVLMVGWDISRKYAVITPREERDLVELGTDKAAIAVDCQATLKRFTRDQTKLPGFDLPDPITLAIALDESIATRSAAAVVHVNTGMGRWRGHTLMDWRVDTKLPHTRVVLEASHEAFLSSLHQSLSSEKERSNG